MVTTSDDFKDFCRDEYPQLVGSLRLACSGDRHLAEDLAQEAFTRLYRDWTRVSSGSAPRAWLYKVAMNLVRSNWRRNTVRRRIEAHLTREQVARDHAEDVANRDLVQRALACLQLRERSVIVLRQYRQLSVRETATALNMTDQAVRSLHHRAIGKLRDALTETPEESSHGT